MKARISAYLAKCPPAVSGQRGHDATFSVACALVQGFGLTVEEAMPHLEEYNLRCRPPWTTQELLHKLGDAEKKSDARGRGHFLLDKYSLPPATKSVHPPIGEPIPGVKPFKPKLRDGYDGQNSLINKIGGQMYMWEEDIPPESKNTPSYPSRKTVMTPKVR